MGLYRRPDAKDWWMSFAYNGKLYRRSTGTSDRKIAERILRKVQTQIVENKWFDMDLSSRHTFDELMERYLQEVVCHKKLSTQETNKIQIAHLICFFGNLTLDKVTPELVSDYRTERLKAGVKLRTIGYELIVLSHAFNVALREWKWVRENPMVSVKIYRKENHIERWLTQEEEESLLSLCNDWLKVLVVFALSTGMRMAEILNLKWQYVDMRRKTVTILESKNGQIRVLPLNQNAMCVLQRINREGKIANIEEYVFTKDGLPISKHQLQYYFGEAVKKAGIAHLRFHDLRHTFATRLVQSGIDLYKVSKLLGHMNIKTTQRYSHHYPESLRNGVEILDKVKSKKKAQLHDSFTFIAAPSIN